MKKIVFACAAAVMAASTAFVGTAPAFAEGASMVIDTAPYNLQSQAGRSAIADRISSAGRLVCGNYRGRDVKNGRSFESCRSAAVADGMAQLDGLSRHGSVVVGAR